MNMSIRQALQQARQRLPGDTPGLDAQVLLGHVLGQPRAWLLGHSDETLATDQVQQFESLVGRTAAGEPMPYVLERWQFFGLEFIVTPDVLIPRPETELLVEKALGWMQQHLPRRGRQLVVDVGTGSGCVAVCLSFFFPTAEVVAVDVSEAALEVARANAERHDVSHRIEFRRGSLLEPVDGPIDVLCANLPYIASETLPDLAVSRVEPALALDGGAGGMRWIEELLQQAPAKMDRPGLVALEIDAGQGAAVGRLAQSAFPGGVVECHRDLAGLDRVVTVQG